MDFSSIVVSDLSNIGEQAFYSLQRVFVGVLVAAVLGIVCGLLRSASPQGLKKNLIFRFLLDGPKFPPPIAWIPIVILLFGIGEFSAYTIVFIGAFSPIFTNSFEAAEGVPQVIANTGRNLGLKGGAYYRKIVFWWSLPHIFTGVRVGIGMGWMSVIAAEMISGQSGLGYTIQLDRLNLRTELVVVDIFVIGVVGFFLFEGSKKLEKILIPWKQIS